MEKINATQIFMTDKVIVRSGEDESFIGFQILPKDDTQGFFVKSSPFIKVAIKETDSEENLRVLSVKGISDSDEICEGFVSVTLDDGTEAECEVLVLPKYIAPPSFAKEPRIYFHKGFAIVDYEFGDMGENIDQTQISWYRLGKFEKSRFSIIDYFRKTTEDECRRIAVSRDNVPLKKIPLTMADVGKYMKLSIKPKHSNSYIGQEVIYVSEVIKEEYIEKNRIELNPISADDYEELNMRRQKYFSRPRISKTLRNLE